MKSTVEYVASQSQNRLAIHGHLKSLLASVSGITFAVITLLLLMHNQLPQVGAHALSPRDDAWVVDGRVIDIAADDSNYYLAGTFSNTNEYTGHGVALDTTNFQLADSIRTRIEGTVLTAIPDGTGGWFAGGVFTEVDNVPMSDLVHVNADGSFTTTWLPNPWGGNVYSLYLDGTTLYVGGDFERVFGQFGTIRTHVAAFDVSNLSSATLLPWNPIAQSTVYTITGYGSYIYLGGAFSWINSSVNVDSTGLAAVDPITGTLEPSWSPTIAGTVREVRDLEIAADGSVMYVGGSITSINGVLRDDLAATTLADGVSDASIFAWNPDIQGSIDTIELTGDESTLIIGGNFTHVRQGQTNDLTASNIAAISADETDETATPVTTWTPNANGEVLFADLHGTDLYVAGGFTTVNGSARRYFANLDISSLASVTLGSLDLNGPLNDIGWTVASTDGELFVGGAFEQIGGVPRRFVAEYDLTTNQPTDLDLQITGGIQVTAIAKHNNILYLGGTFDGVLGSARDDIAAVDLTTNTLLTWNPGAAGPGGGHVTALQVDGDTLYVGGNFTSLGGTARSRFAAYDISDPNNITLLPLDPGTNNTVLEIAADSSHVYLGGNFTLAGNNGGSPATGAVQRLAAIDKATGAANESWTYPDTGEVDALEVKEDIHTVYFGGNFSTVGGVARKVAAIDTTTGQLTSWAPSLNSNARSLFLDENAVYIAGDFSTCDGQTQRICAYQYDGTLASWNPELGAGVVGVRAPIIRRDGILHLGGNFATVAGEERQGYVQFGVTQVQFSETSSVAPEPDVSTTITAEATQPDTVSADIAVGSGGTATPGDDFDLNTTTINFTPGQTTANIDIGIDDDNIAEGDETAVIEITEVSVSGVRGSVNAHTITITDDDFAGGTLVQSDNGTATTEGQAPDTYTVALTSQPVADVTVQLSVDNAAQATVSPSSLQFTAANWNVPQQVSVSAIDDTEIDGTASVSISHIASSTDPMYDALDLGTIQASIADNDSASGGPVQVIQGDNPAAQAIAVSKERYPTSGSADGVALTREDVAIDALTSGPLVNLSNMSLLLTPSVELASTTATEIERATGGPSTHKPIYLIGGEDALSPAVATGLQALGYDNVTRIGGDNRRQTAKFIADKIAQASGTVTDAFVADDSEFVDALTIGAEAGRVQNNRVMPILLARRGQNVLDTNVREYLSEQSGLQNVTVVGGTAALPDAALAAISSARPDITVSRIGGVNRYETNRMIADIFFSTPEVAFAARGDRSSLPGAGQLSALSASATFYGALFAGTLGAERIGPVLLVTPTEVPMPIQEYIVSKANSLDTVTFIGNQSELDSSVLETIASLI